jgi:hypothetical protein
MIMQHDEDPAEALIERIGDLTDFVVPFNKILVGIYIRPNIKKVAGTDRVIHLSDDTVGEDKYQGKAGIILKRGPMAFVDDDRIKFNGLNPQVGEWIAFRPSDGLKIDIRSDKGHCILLDDTMVRLVIPAPDLVF